MVIQSARAFQTHSIRLAKLAVNLRMEFLTRNIQRLSTGLVGR